MTQVNRVKAYRVAKGVSQLELARRVGVSRQTINMIENDKYNPTLNLCIRIAETLDVTLNDLFWEER
ncbi:MULTISPECIES: helix-turn-helix transcriptional regulator [unclassified Staphylococcus]|uniref:helix-turn-helix transcriptional regulator n=1 Tax=unclassified Staphylococcus TaxID=91994 RepID=UPI0021CF23F9|nr:MULTISPECIES: helix-turn-helix transcriptional regulator [unclassified Staphylococcus]UXR69345.1 helix-turn-helix transcriptional regulator [Staphylococcus sp. IVB6246]UXR71400.1 helix-turn-helix transcriptional regulator [Staphylococcus sp. IVB6240]UXR73679.1 helix-turn-helix transcriptional regulator [Staphylococcus sp. IVB6238]UXR75996.1 helix-turn-helix transcriptional regulator [Staphylococcus sp. IVB6233]UXR80193.1 helix-turn-helix transcriptional regulator [Staphylococcus sp. IVB6218